MLNGDFNSVQSQSEENLNALCYTHNSVSMMLISDFTEKC
jgi:hypothetical protein